MGIYALIKRPISQRTRLSGFRELKKVASALYFEYNRTQDRVRIIKGDKYVWVFKV